MAVRRWILYRGHTEAEYNEEGSVSTSAPQMFPEILDTFQEDDKILDH